MADHPNAEILRRGLEAFAKGDLATVNEVLADDVVWHVGGSSPLSGDYRGKEAVMGFFARLAEIAPPQVSIHDVAANDEHAIALVEMSAAKPGGDSIQQRAVHVYHVRDGRATEAWFYNEDQAALDAFWSS